MQNAWLDEAQAGIKIARRNINDLRYADDTTLMAESEEKLKSLLIKVKEETEKSWLKPQYSKTMIMASGPITSWQIDGEEIETVTDFIFFKRLFSFSSLSAIRVVLSVYRRLSIFLPAILIPACVSSSPAFLMMFSACKLNKQDDNIQP